MCKSVGYVHMRVSEQRGYKGVLDPVRQALQMELGIKFSELSAAEPPLQPFKSVSKQLGFKDYFWKQNSYAGTMDRIDSIAQMRRLSLRELKWLIRGHVDNKEWKVR